MATSAAQTPNMTRQVETRRAALIARIPYPQLPILPSPPTKHCRDRIGIGGRPLGGGGASGGGGGSWLAAAVLHGVWRWKGENGEQGGVCMEVTSASSGFLRVARTARCARTTYRTSVLLGLLAGGSDSF